jgi:hypothetical protein
MRIDLCFLILIILLSLLFILYFGLKTKNIKFKFSDKNTIGEKYMDPVTDPLLRKVFRLYYINLEKDIERKHRFLSNLENANCDLDVNRVEAIGIDDFKKYKFIRPVQCKKHMKWLVKSNRVQDIEFCCLLSHIKAIHQAYLDGNEYALIMEDDMYFLRYPNWMEIIKSSPEDAEMLQLYMSDGNFDIYGLKEKWVKDIVFSTGSYIINKKGMERVLRNTLGVEYDREWSDINVIDFSTGNTKSFCIADDYLWKSYNKYMYTSILFNTEGLDSTIHPDHLGLHNQGVNKINELFKEGY